MKVDSEAGGGGELGRSARAGNFRAGREGRCKPDFQARFPRSTI